MIFITLVANDGEEQVFEVVLGKKMILKPDTILRSVEVWESKAQNYAKT